MFSPLARSKYLATASTAAASAASTPATAATSTGSTGSLSSCESIASPPARPEKLPIGRAHFGDHPAPLGRASSGDSKPASSPSSISSASSSEDSPASTDDWASGFATQEEDNDEGRDSPPSSDDDGDHNIGKKQAKRPAGIIFATPRPSASASKRHKRVSFASDQTVRHSNASSGHPSDIHPSITAPKLGALATVASAAREAELRKTVTVATAQEASEKNSAKEASDRISLGSLFGVVGRPLIVYVSKKKRISTVNQATIRLPAEDMVDGRTPPALFALKTSSTDAVCGEWRFAVGPLPQGVNVVIGRDILERIGRVCTKNKEE